MQIDIVDEQSVVDGAYEMAAPPRSGEAVLFRLPGPGGAYVSHERIVATVKYVASDDLYRCVVTVRDVTRRRGARRKYTPDNPGPHWPDCPEVKGTGSCNCGRDFDK